MHRPNRRLFLTSAALTVSALGGGCLADTADEYATAGDDDRPIDADADELVLDRTDLDGDGWVLSREDDLGTDSYLYRDFTRGNETIALFVDVHDSVAAAAASFEEDRAFRERTAAGYAEYGIGSEAFFQEGALFGVAFRDANVRGGVRHDVEGEGDRSLVLETAVRMHERWR